MSSTPPLSSFFHYSNSYFSFSSTYEPYSAGEESETTPNSEYKKLCNLILEKKFEATNQLYLKGLSSSFSKKIFNEEFENCTVKRKLTYKDIRNILHEAETFYHNFPFDHTDPSRLSIKFFNLLLKNLRNLSTKQLSEELARWGEIEKKVLLNGVRFGLMGLQSLTQLQTHSLEFSLLSSIPFLHPAFEKPENLLGLASGTIASAMNYHPLAALGIGLTASTISRIPIVQSLSQKAIIQTGQGIKQTVNILGPRIKPLKTRIIDPLAHITQRTINNGVEIAKSGIQFLETQAITPMARTAQSVLDAGIGAIESGSKFFETSIMSPVAEMAENSLNRTIEIAKPGMQFLETQVVIPMVKISGRALLSGIKHYNWLPTYSNKTLDYADIWLGRTVNSAVDKLLRRSNTSQPDMPSFASFIEDSEQLDEERKILITAIWMSIGHFSYGLAKAMNASHFTAITFSATLLHPVLRRHDNLNGLITGYIASNMNFSSVATIGIGLIASTLSRLPGMQLRRGLFAYGLISTLGLSEASAITFSAANLHPVLSKPENLIGVIAGSVASSINFDPVSSIAIGIFSSMIARIPGMPIRNGLFNAGAKLISDVDAWIDATVSRRAF
jgi:hypothetical protein